MVSAHGITKGIRHQCYAEIRCCDHRRDQFGKGCFCISIRYSERLADGNIESSVGSVGDSHDNALAETTNGLNKAEVIHRQSWKRAKRWNWPH